MRNRRFPKYPDDVDYTTNSPSYYDDLARKQKLIKLLSKKIWEYENTLDETLEQIEKRLTDYILENDLLMTERLENWDQRIDEMPEEMRSLFVTWLNDGTLEQIINHDVLGNKADQSELDITNDQIADIEKRIKTLDLKADMVADESLEVGDYVRTRGFRKIDDGGGELFKIFPYDSEENDRLTVYILDNGNIAKSVDRKYSLGFHNTETAIQQMFDVGYTYVSNSQKFIYGPGEFSALDENFTPDQPQVDCSSFGHLLLNGYRFEHSKYNNHSHNTSFYPWVHKYSPNENTMTVRWANWMAFYGLTQDWMYYVKPDFSNIEVGDMLFWSNKDNGTGERREGHPSRDFMHIIHNAVFTGFDENGEITLLQGTLGHSQNIAGATAWSPEQISVAVRFPLGHVTTSKTRGGSQSVGTKRGYLDLTEVIPSGENSTAHTEILSVSPNIMNPENVERGAMSADGKVGVPSGNNRAITGFIRTELIDGKNLFFIKDLSKQFQARDLFIYDDDQNFVDVVRWNDNLEAWVQGSDRATIEDMGSYARIVFWYDGGDVTKEVLEHFKNNVMIGTRPFNDDTFIKHEANIYRSFHKIGLGYKLKLENDSYIINDLDVTGNFQQFRNIQSYDNHTNIYTNAREIELEYSYDSPRKNKITRTTKRTFTLELENTRNGSIEYWVENNLVMLNLLDLRIDKENLEGWDSITVGTMPTGFRPRRSISNSVTLENATLQPVLVRVTQAGNVQIRNRSSNEVKSELTNGMIQYGITY